MMENGWKEVFLTALDYRAHIAKDLLEEAGIKAVVLDQKDAHANGPSIIVVLLIQ